MNQNHTSEVPCPSCGFFTIGETSFGSYNICNLCDWEDDAVQLANPACPGGANKLSLIDSQRNILEKLPLARNEYNEIKRDQNWRPLNNSEIDKYEKEKVNGFWKNHAAISIEESYWIKSKQ
jgi:hypothetical protein